jgi:hypothetical protein
LQIRLHDRQEKIAAAETASGAPWENTAATSIS